MPPADAHEALIYLMVVVSAVDRDMRDHELAKIGEIVRGAPAFAGFDSDDILETAQSCQRLLQRADGLNAVLAAVDDVVPEHMRETAYAFAVDVAAADRMVRIEERRILQILRQRLAIDPLVAAAIERASTVRHSTLYDQ